MRGEVTNRVLLGRKRHGRPGIQSGRQRWERPGWQQTWRLEDHRTTAAAKITLVLKSLNGFLWNSRPSGTWGRPTCRRRNGHVHPRLGTQVNGPGRVILS